jgi:hypothetical protein
MTSNPNLIEGQPPRRRPLYPIRFSVQPLFAKTFKNFSETKDAAEKRTAKICISEILTRAFLKKDEKTAPRFHLFYTTRWIRVVWRFLEMKTEMKTTSRR